MDAKIPAGHLYIFIAALPCHLQLKVNLTVDLVELAACPIKTQTEATVYFMEIYKI